MSEEEINEALKIIKEPITVNSIEYKYFNQENYEKLLSVYKNAKWFVSNWEQALQNIKDLQQKVEEKDKEIDRLNNIIKKAIKYINSFGGEWKNYSLYYREIMNNLLNILTLKENNK